MTSPELTVIVRMTAKPGDEQALLEALRADRRDTLAQEPGCRDFRVLMDDSAPQTLVLNEVYEDRDAFESHRRQPHFRAFEDAVSRYGADRASLSLLRQWTPDVRLTPLSRRRDAT